MFLLLMTYVITFPQYRSSFITTKEYLEMLPRHLFMCINIVYDVLKSHYGTKQSSMDNDIVEVMSDPSSTLSPILGPVSSENEWAIPIRKSTRSTHSLSSHYTNLVIINFPPYIYLFVLIIFYSYS